MRDGDVVRVDSGLTPEESVRQAEEEVRRLEEALAAAVRSLELARAARGGEQFGLPLKMLGRSK